MNQALKIRQALLIYLLGCYHGKKMEKPEGAKLPVSDPEHLGRILQCGIQDAKNAMAWLITDGLVTNQND